MRRVLLSALCFAAALGTFSIHEVNAAPVVTASPLIAQGPSGVPIERVYYYRHGYYPYRYHGMYYHHRYYRYGRWHYY